MELCAKLKEIWNKSFLLQLCCFFVFYLKLYAEEFQILQRH